MQSLKRWLIAAGAVVLLIALCACGSKTDPITSRKAPPSLTVSCGKDSIGASRGTYSWTWGSSKSKQSVTADGPGPLELFKRNELKMLQLSDNCTVKLDFETEPTEISVEYWPAENAETMNYEGAKELAVSGSSFTAPSDGIYLYSIRAVWKDADGNGGDGYYMFYTHPPVKTAAAKTTDLMKGVKASVRQENPDALAKGGPTAAEFAVRLFKACGKDGKNTLVSPLSVLSALAMTVNGAEGQTLAEMESVLGMSRDELNSFFLSYAKCLPSGKGYKLSLANSIWFKTTDEFSPSKDFLQFNADYYKAEIYEAPFNDTTLKDINSWVSEKTDKMIPSILKDIPEDAVMYLINALAFDAEWETVYKDIQVREGEFTCGDGTKKTVDFMYGGEHKYLELPGATGFIKYYKEGKYAFAALLPSEGTDLADFIASLSGSELYKALSEPHNATVLTSIPKFEFEYETELSSVLKAMGMADAFDREHADLTGIGTVAPGDRLFINRVLHKTYIAVDEKGTKAGAATAVEVQNATAAPPIDIKEVYLDRPFVYMLIDCETDLPFFIGAMDSIESK